MRISLKTKFTLTTALLVLGVAAVISTVYVSTLTHQLIQQTDDRARVVAQQVYMQAGQALKTASYRGAAPASESPEHLREFVRAALDEDTGLSSLVEASLAYSPTIYEITITDLPGVALFSSDTSLLGRTVARRGGRPGIELLTGSSFLEQLRALYGRQRVYEVSVPFNLGDKPFGDVRVTISTVFLRRDISSRLQAAGLLALGAVFLSTLLAAVVSHVSLAPLARISAQLDRITRGEKEIEPVQRGDELGQVSTKINLIGQQLRGVREIFSTLRENLNQIMAGLDDGLLLFTRDGRAVLASPSVEKFLGASPELLLGRRVSEVFPPEHPVRKVLRIADEQLEAVAGEEVLLDSAGHAGASGSSSARPRRVGVNVHVITEHGTRMGALVMLRDLESLERLGSELQVSERMAALGRVMAGVAHEVKNPLNSMRLWLENLRESVSTDQEASQQALKILDSEIDRLDRVVKTFLDFAGPVELRLEETNLADLLREVAAVARPEVEKAHVEFRLALPEASLPDTGGVPPVRVDRQLIKQAVLNLVLNACAAMKEGGRLTLSLRRLRPDASNRGDMAEISVADTGPGIAPEHRAKIFQLFFTTRPGGSGIGLATAFRIVQLHGGSIDFESEAGRGTTFRMGLPLSRAS